MACPRPSRSSTPAPTWPTAASATASRARSWTATTCWRSWRRSAARPRARRGEGPTLLEFKTFRMRGHEEASGTAYVPKPLLEEWARKDPLARFEQWLSTRGPLDDATRDKLRAELKPVIDTLVDEALAAPDPASSAERELADVYAPSALRVQEPDPSVPVTELRYVDAIRDGLREVMRRRPEAILLGQDIAEYGGVFKVTEGFVAEFGKPRVRNTPIIESSRGRSAPPSTLLQLLCQSSARRSRRGGAGRRQG